MEKGSKDLVLVARLVCVQPCRKGVRGPDIFLPHMGIPASLGPGHFHGWRSLLAQLSFRWAWLQGNPHWEGGGDPAGQLRWGSRVSPSLFTCHSLVWASLGPGLDDLAD